MKRNKKYNKMKGALAFMRFGLNNLAVWRDESQKKAEIVDYKHCRNVVITDSIVKAVTEVRHKWNIHLIAIGLDSNEDPCFKLEEHLVNEPLLQEQLVDYLVCKHEILAAEFSGCNTLTNVAWLAVPNGDTITTEQVEAVINYKDAW